MTQSPINWNRYRKLNPSERIEFLLSQNIITQTDLSNFIEKQLDISTANQIVENVLTTFSLPYSLVPNVLVDGKTYTLPFVTEEPSVVAAATYASSLIKRSGGFKTSRVGRLMTGQIALYNVTDFNKVCQLILSHKDKLLELANAAYPSIVKRGGGAKDLTVEQKDKFIICYLQVDTKEAMGANMMNTMLEALKLHLEELTSSKILMSILSNYSIGTLTTSECSIQLKYLSRDLDEAVEIAQKISLASDLAKVDVFRATTHNKGIFNGIDSLVIATGNDWRAIEAACHAYACHEDGKYQGLSTWTYNKTTNCLDGKLTLPMPIATKGGSIGINPTVQLSHKLLGDIPAITLASLIVSIGLAQNFAALKSLVTTGIQAGHMKLQAKSLAIIAGAEESEIHCLVGELLKSPTMNLEIAKKLLKNCRNK